MRIEAVAALAAAIVMRQLIGLGAARRKIVAATSIRGRLC